MPILPKTTNFYENIILFTSEFNRCIFIHGWYVERSRFYWLFFYNLFTDFFFTQLYALKKKSSSKALYIVFSHYIVFWKRKRWNNGNDKGGDLDWIADVELYQLPCYIEVGTLSLHPGAKSISICLFSLYILLKTKSLKSNQHCAG